MHDASKFVYSYILHPHTPNFPIFLQNNYETHARIEEHLLRLPQLILTKGKNLNYYSIATSHTWGIDPL